MPDNNEYANACVITRLDADTMSDMQRAQLERACREMATLPEIARAMGLTPEALFRLERKYESFPQPIDRFGRAWVYSIDEVTDFHLGVGRIYGKARDRA